MAHARANWVIYALFMAREKHCKLVNDKIPKMLHITLS